MEFPVAILGLPLALLSVSLSSCRSHTPVACENFTVSEGIELPRGRGGHAAAVLNGQVIAVGGTDWSKDHTTKYWLKDSIIFRDGQWHSGPELPFPIGYSLFASDGKSLFLAGGTDGTKSLNTTYVLTTTDPAATWQQLAPLPLTICSGAGVEFSGYLYVSCGFTEDGPTNAMWRLDTSNPRAQWQTCRPIPGAARAFPAMIADDQHIYLLGGMTTDENSKLLIMKDTYQYDPQKDGWSRMPDLPQSGYAWSASEVDNHRVLLTGRADGQVHRDIWLVTLPDMTIHNMGELIIQSTTAPLIAVSSDEWWLLGGEPDSKKNRTPIVTIIKRH